MYNNSLKLLICLCFVLVSIVQADAINESFDNIAQELQATARALITKNGKLLLVSDDGNFWYTPGGRLEKSETLTECLIREVKEETGIQVQPQKMLFIEEFFDNKNKIHKIEVYFVADIKRGRISSNWKDQGGSVKFVKFFSVEEIRNMKNIAPDFLKDGEWKILDKNPYKGYRGR
jgi:8-oxo-dGTP diphosphatase